MVARFWGGRDLGPSSRSLNSRIERELIRMVYGGWTQYADGLPFAAVLAAALSGLVPMLGHAPLRYITIWLSLQIVWSVCALSLWRFHRHHERRAGNRVWHLRLCLLWATRGTIWGFLIGMFWSSATPAGQALLCTMVLGIMVSSFYALAPCRFVFGSNLCATVLSVLASLAAVGDGAFARMIAIIFPAFSLIIFSYGLQLSAKYRRAVALGFENEHMTRVLAHAKRTAEQANLAKSRFLANMSHELRTPLNAIIGFSEVIRDRMFGPQADKYSEYAADVVTSARHLLNLIQGVLDLAKIEAGKMAFERTQFVIGPLLADCARAMRAGALDKGLDLLLDDTSAGCLVYADETAVRQIVLNLLANAIKFTSKGWVCLAVSTADSELLIEVSDTGCGIPKHVLPRMFLPFERADNSFSASQGGTGLGLALVQHLAQAHGGSCHVESTPGQGTTFRISMPIVSNESMMAAA